MELPGNLMAMSSRSPHGERGLKYVIVFHNAVGKIVALLMESVD